jgi:hypothetical protein
MVNIQPWRLYVFYVFIFLLPWQTRWIVRDPVGGGDIWEYSRISLYGWDILLGVLVLVSLPLIWREIGNFKSNSNTQNSNSKVLLVYLLLLLLAVSSILWSPDKVLALVWCLRLLAAGFVWLLVKTLKPRWSAVCWSLTSAGVIQALWAVGQFVSQSTLASKWLGVAIHQAGQPGSSVILTQAGIWLRAYAGQVHPNVLGGLLVITALSTAWLFINSFGDKGAAIKNRTWLALYTIQLFGLFFSFSRGAWIALAASLVIWRRREHSNRQALSFIFALTVVIFVMMGSILWQPTVGRLFGGTRLEQQSIEERVGSVGESRGLLASVWWRGVGLGNYTVTLEQARPGLRSWSYQPVHNIFLLSLTELGVIGLGLWLWLLWLRLRPMVTLNSLFLVPILITGLFDHYWWTIPSMFMLFWLLMLLADSSEVGPSARA